MPTKWIDKLIKCPFYKREENNRIVCEGISERSTLSPAYEHHDEKMEHMKKHCMSIEGCRRCPIYSLLDRLYAYE